MGALYRRRRIRRFYEKGKDRDIEDDIIRENHLIIRLDGEDFLRAVVSPSLIKEFVLGFLLTRGMIDGLQDVSSLEISADTASVARSPSRRGALPQLDLLESTGTRNMALEHLPLIAGRLSGSALRVSAEVLIKGMRMLSEMPLYKRTGGTHCAILFSPAGDPIFSAEDIGRHNAVDKAIGGGLTQSIDFGHCWLAVSGRLPADMVFKPLVAGIPLVASLSAATSDGIEIGERAGLTIVGFARGDRFNCYCHPERII
ncbi:MAG: formate dehydrogenase accessory sulfurtransferase FdhD [Desulfobacteraceae bacterium]